MEKLPVIFRRRTGEDKSCCQVLGVIVMQVRVPDETGLRFRLEARTSLIDWGDGTSGYEPEHSYSQEGVYEIRIAGTEINLLDVSRCRVEVLDLSQCGWIEHLNCSGNDLRTLDVSPCDWLVDLDCSENRIEKLNLEIAPKLKVLDCHSNRLSQLFLKNCPGLLYLYCSRNLLTAIDLAVCVSLCCVDIGENLFRKDALNDFLSTLPYHSDKGDSYLMCDQNEGYSGGCNVASAEERGWCLL